MHLNLSSCSVCLVIVSIVLYSCVVDTVDTRLKFVNNSTKQLLIHHEFSSINDTTINCETCYSVIKDDYFFLPKDTSRLVLHGMLFDEFLQKNKKQILRVFVISKDSLIKYGWEEIKNKNIVIKRYEINSKYLHDNNWIITYP